MSGGERFVWHGGGETSRRLVGYSGDPIVLFIVITMLVILGLAALVLVYAAFPHRGVDVPAAPWLGQAMERASDAMPVLEADEQDPWSIRS
jgi:hypothetical protein